MFNAAVARIGLFCFILWCQGCTPGPCGLSAFPPDLSSQCLTPSLVFILSFVILLSSTTPSLLSHFLPSFKSILCFCCGCFVLCAVWVIRWNAVLIFLWLTYCSRYIHSLLTIIATGVQLTPALLLERIVHSIATMKLIPSLSREFSDVWLSLLLMEAILRVVLGPHTGGSPLWLLLLSILRATENPQDGEEAMS